MKPVPLYIILAQLKKMPLALQIEFLRELVSKERLHSIRRNELESILRGKRTKQLQKENRSAA